MDNQQIARTILTAVGPENIIEAYNCMTRLRLRVKAVTVTKEELKKIAGVKGVIRTSLQRTRLRRIWQNPVSAANRQNLSLQRGHRFLRKNSNPNTKSAMAKNCMPK